MKGRHAQLSGFLGEVRVYAHSSHTGPLRTKSTRRYIGWLASGLQSAGDHRAGSNQLALTSMNLLHPWSSWHMH